MEPQTSKGKAKAGPSAPARKRNRPSEGQLTRVPRAPPLQREQVRKFGFKIVRKDGKQWYFKHTDAKYILEVYIDRAILMRECMSMVQRIEDINMNFIFHQPTECNLHLVREFYSNWDPSHPEHLLKGRRKMIRFTAADINDLLGICYMVSDPQLVRPGIVLQGMIYALVCSDVEINCGVDEEELDYKPEVITHPMDITTARSTSGTAGLILTMLERQTRTDEVLDRLYGLMMMMSKTKGRSATLEELYVVEFDYPLGHHARTMLRIGPNFVEPIDDDIPTDEEHRYRDSDVESDEEDQSDDNGADDDGDNVDGTPDGITAIVPFD
ncbi:hypothetical protein BC332_13140 [Capsicum chinense]|nr:hypothetical protein BC332_13140 [Capsicum chinense]